jgi:hypothetical protein
VGFNPRAIKRVFSGVKLLRHLSDALPNAGPGQLLASDEEVTRVRFGALCLQNAYEPLYALLARSEVNEGLFAKLKSPETLATEPEFDALRAALCGRDGSGKTLRRVALFAAALERAVQLDLDDDQERLSPAEAHHLAETLRFAAVAAPHGYLDGTDMADRYRNEAMAAELADELNARYGETLDSLPTGRRFRMVTRRGLPDGGISVAYWNFRFGEHQMGLTLDFLPTGSAFWATAERRADRAFIHNLLQEAFPDAALPKEAWAYLLDEQEWRYGAPWPQRAQEFRNAATHFLDRFLPALVATAGKQD